MGVLASTVIFRRSSERILAGGLGVDIIATETGVLSRVLAPADRRSRARDADKSVARYCNRELQISQST
jgi:hypothetical protein